MRFFKELKKIDIYKVFDLNFYKLQNKIIFYLTN